MFIPSTSLLSLEAKVNLLPKLSVNAQSRCLMVPAALAVTVIPVFVAQAAPRDVQFVSVDFTTGVIELQNTGTAAEPLDGWRFCSHSELDGFDYTGSGSLDEFSLSAGQSIFLWTNNDAPVSAVDFDVSTLGTFEPFLNGDGTYRQSYSINLYYPNGGSLSFSSSDDMVDHLQWHFDGASTGSSTPRSVTAVNAGLWSAPTDFIVIDSDTTLIELDPAVAGQTAHSPASYMVQGAPSQPGDANADGIVNLLDLDILGANWQSSPADLADGDFNGDNVVNLLDLDILGANWQAGTLFNAALATSGIAVPEPAALCVVMAGVSLIASRRRRH